MSPYVFLDRTAAKRSCKMRSATGKRIIHAIAVEGMLRAREVLPELFRGRRCWQRTSEKERPEERGRPSGPPSMQRVRRVASTSIPGNNEGQFAGRKPCFEQYAIHEGGLPHRIIEATIVVLDLRQLASSTFSPTGLVARTCALSLEIRAALRPLRGHRQVLEPYGRVCHYDRSC